MGVIARQIDGGTTARIPDLNVDLGTNVAESGTQTTTLQVAGENVNLLSMAKNKFGGLVGLIGRSLNIGTDIQVGLTQKVLEKSGILKKTDAKTFGEIGQMSSNIDLLRRVGRERFTPDSLGGIFTGAYTPSTSVFSNFTKELPVTTIGLMADIFVDPLLGLGKIGAVKKATGAVGNALKNGFNLLAREISAVQKVGDALGNLFLTRFGQRETFKTLDRARLIQESLVPKTVNKLVSGVIEKPASIQRRITKVIEGADLADAEIKALALPIRQELDRVGEVISSLNPKLLSEATFQANKGTYFPRLYKNLEFDSDEAISQFLGLGRKPAAARFKARTLTKAEAKATGELIEEAGFPAARALTQLGRQEAKTKFFNEVGKIASDVPKTGWLQLSDDKFLGALAGKFLPRSEYAIITEIRRQVGSLEKNYQRAITLWKTSKTAYSPATISRNDLLNYFMLNPLGGVSPIRLDIYAKTVNELMTDGNLYRLAQKEGLEMTSQAYAELQNRATMLYSDNLGVFKQFWPTAKIFHKKVVDFYGSQDKFFKLANFIKGVTEDGLSPAMAMKRANFYLVNYSEVPKFVEWARKNPFGAPFISFTYGISKPLAKTLLEQPAKLGFYFKAFNAIQSLNPQGIPVQSLVNEQEVLPRWIKKGLFLRLPFRDKFERGQFVNLQYLLPFNILEANSITPSSPTLTIVASLLTNRDTFTGRDLWRESDSKAEKTRRAAMHIYRQIVPSFFPGGFSYNKLLKVIQGRPDYQGRAQSLSLVLLDVLGGIKVTPIDTSIEAQKRANEKQREINELKSQLNFILRDKTLFPDERKKEASKVMENLVEASRP